MAGSLFVISIGDAVIQAGAELLARFWTLLEESSVHPIANFAHCKQESLIRLNSAKEAEALEKKLQTRMGLGRQDLSIIPYILYGTDACILNAKPRFSVWWINMIGLDDATVCEEVATLLGWFVPQRGHLEGSPILQSVKIERMLTRDVRYHVRVEVRTDEQHFLDYEEVSQKMTERERDHPTLRQHCWSGALTVQRQRTILFYARSDITDTGMNYTLIEDPAAIQEIFVGSTSTRLPLRRDLLKLSQGIRRLGYVQRLFVDGGVENDDDDGNKDGKAHSSEAPTTPRRRTLSLASVLDSIEHTSSLSDVIIVHLDADGLYNTAAIRVPLRINATHMKLNRSFDFSLENFHRILALSDLPHDLFHLIGHMPSDVKQIYSSIQEKKHVRNPSEAHRSASASAVGSPDQFLPSQLPFAHLCAHTDSLEFHPSYLSQLLMSLQSNRRKLVKLEAFRLIQSLDISIIMEDDRNTQTMNALLHSLPNGRITKFTPLLLQVPPNVITVVATRITANCIRALTECAAPYTQQYGRFRQLSVASISRSDVDGGSPVSASRNATEDEVAAMNEVDCVEITLFPKEAPSGVSHEEFMEQFSKDLRKAGLEYSADISIMADTFARRNRRAATFDMDSTLIQNECIDEMATFCGVGDQVKQITHRAMNGELDFKQALTERVKLLQGANADQLFSYVYNQILWTPHAKFVCHTLRALGFNTAVFSGGFFPTASTVQRHLKLHHARANLLELDVKTGLVTGRLVSDSKIVDADVKARSLKKMCAEAYIDPDLSIAVGDGANDLKMLQAAGIGIAFMAKPALQSKTKFHINQLTLSPILYLLGLSKDDCNVLLSETS